MTEPKNLFSLNSFTEDTFDEARSSWRERGEGGNGGRDLEFSLSHAREKKDQHFSLIITFSALGQLQPRETGTNAPMT